MDEKYPPKIGAPSKEQNELIQLVSFMLDKEEYGVEVLKVREIIRIPSITRMPNSPDFVEGIINLRGKVIPVISMRKRCSLSEADYSNQTRIMVMDTPCGLNGFIVDGVSEVIRIRSGEIQPPPLISGGNNQEYLTGVFNRGGRLLIVLDSDLLFSREEQTALIAMQ